MIHTHGLYITITDDVGENVGGAFCEIYTDSELDDKIDDFIIHNSIPREKWEECIKGYLDCNAEWLKETNMKKVYIVHVEVIFDQSELKNEVQVFGTKEKAIEYAKSEIERESEDAEISHWIVDDCWEERGIWEAYEDGYYLGAHACIKLEEKFVQ